MDQATQSPDAFRTEALNHLRGGMLYPGADLAWKYLRELGDDAQLRHELIGALTRLGLDALANHVARGFTGPTGAIPWGARRERWADNLKALQSRDPQLASQLRAVWNSCRESFRLYQCADGNYQILLVSQPGIGTWLPALADHRCVAEQVQPPGGSFASGNCLMIYGVHFGWLLSRAYRETKNVFLDFSCCIHWLAPSHAELAAALCLHDWQDVLADRRVLLFVGPDCIRQFEEFLGDNPRYPIPAWRLTQPSWDSSRVDDLPAALQRITEHRQQEALRSRKTLENVYQDRDVEYWAARYARRDEEPLRVLGIVSRHSTFIRGSMRDCLGALESLGCQCRLLTEAESFFLGNTAREMHEAQIELMPDLLLMIDNHRGQMPVMLTPNVPVLMWIQDALGRLLSPEVGRNMGPLDFVMGYAKKACVKECEYPPDGFLECDVPTGFKANPSIEPRWRDVHSCDVSFVSTASKPPEQIHAERRAESPSELHPLIDAIYEEVRSRLASGRHVCHPKALLEQLMAETGVEITDASTRQDLETWYVYRLFDWGIRQETLRWTAEWARRTGRKFHLYGRGWDTFPGLEEFAHRHIWDRRELAAIHSLSRINLQLFAYTALHQRTYDILGVGGFALFRRTPTDYRDDELALLEAFLQTHPPRDVMREENREIAELARNQFPSVEEWVTGLERRNGHFEWDRGKSAAAQHPCLRKATFDSPKTLSERLDHYLEDEQARHRIARELRDSILPTATYGARMRDALDFVARRLRLRAKYGCRGHVPARGPEAGKNATILIAPRELRSVCPEYQHRYAEATRKLSKWAQECTACCEIVPIEQGTPSETQERFYDLIERGEPDLVLAFGKPLFLAGTGAYLKTLVLGCDLHGTHFDLPRGERVFFAGASNHLGSEYVHARAYASWTGLAEERVRCFWWPWEWILDGRTRSCAVAESPGCDLAVTLSQMAPATELIRMMDRTIPEDEKETVTPVLGRIASRHRELFGDPFAQSLPSTDAIYREVTAGIEADGPASARLARLRMLALPRFVESWIQEQWLERLARWAADEGLTLRIAAPDSWKSHPTLGPLVVPWGAPNGEPQARLHVSFCSGAATPIDDMAKIISGIPTLLWRSPRWHDRPAGTAETGITTETPRTEDLSPDAGKLRFTSWQELTERIRAHLADPTTLSELSRHVGEAIRPALSPGRIMTEILDWALSSASPPPA